MKISPFLVAAFAVLTVGHSAYSQEQDRPRFGIGISLSDILALDNAGTIYFPIRASSHFRLEPEIGFWWFVGDQSSLSFFHAGVGVFGVRPHGKAWLYYGARLGYERVGEITKNYFVTPALGIEYDVSDHFSVGGEAQVWYISRRRKEFSLFSTDISSLSTGTSIFLRFYF